MTYEQEVQIFCNNIKYLRATNNLSERKMAKILGIKKKDLILLENYTLPPNMHCDILFRITDYFKIDLLAVFKPLE